uniref:DMT family transporter n=1 Tax=Cellvibrio fontiphilus TaxID=1815559 RepID=UPI002B4BFE9B|nr:DMT family transporter [Cellvibrio fontiphilus]
MSSAKSALLSLHLGAFLMGATGLFSKIIELPAWDITGYRTWVAALVLFAWVWWRERNVALRSARDYRRMLLLGALLALHWVTFFYSMQVANIAVGMISLYAYPVVTVFLEPWLKGTKLDWRDVISGCLVLFGIYWLVPEFTFSNNMTQGVMWGVISAVTFAVRNLLLSHWFSDQTAARSMSYQVLIVALLMTPVLLLSPHQPSATDGWLLLCLGIFFTAFTHTLLGYSLRYLKAKTVGLVACLQPVYAVGYEIAVLHTYPDLSTLLGGSVIIAAAIYESVREHSKAATTAAVNL